MSDQSTPTNDDAEIKEELLSICRAVWRLGRGTALDLPLDPELLPEEAADKILALFKSELAKREAAARVDENTACQNIIRSKWGTNDQLWEMQARLEQFPPTQQQQQQRKERV